MQVLSVRCGGEELLYYSLTVASKLISANRWSIPVDGVHSESLRRSYRETDHGIKIGRDVFFTEKNLLDLGYEVSINKDHLPTNNIVELGEIKDG